MSDFLGLVARARVRSGDKDWVAAAELWAEVTAANPVNCGGLVQGQNLCKHLWVTAIDLAKLASGTADPSSAPFFIPGQSLSAQYVSPQWTKAVIKPPT